MAEKLQDIYEREQKAHSRSIWIVLGLLVVALLIGYAYLGDPTAGDVAGVSPAAGDVSNSHAMPPPISE